MKKDKILICDDEEGVRESMRLILEKDYDLCFACDGYEAIDLVKTECPNLALLDIKMPVMNGIETLKHIQRVNPETKVLFVTGYQYTDVAKDALQVGAQSYIVKPFSSQELMEAVKKTLKK